MFGMGGQEDLRYAEFQAKIRAQEAAGDDAAEHQDRDAPRPRRLYDWMLLVAVGGLIAIAFDDIAIDVVVALGLIVLAAVQVASYARRGRDTVSKDGR
jgi:hypothetical protein